MGYNESQKRIIETTEGLVVVDAGPGTGKTFTTTERYFGIISKPDVSPRDVLVMTFTRNAAAELQERLKKKLAEEGRLDESKYIMAKTFDSFCRGIVMDSPELVSSFFGLDVKLTRSAQLVENETLNRDYFTYFLDGFLNDYGSDYGPWSAIASENGPDLLRLLNNLMSRGIIPMRSGWFSMDPEKDVLGDPELLRAKIAESNPKNSGKQTVLLKSLKEISKEAFQCPEPTGKYVDDVYVEQAIADDRTLLTDFVHDVYYRYIESSINDNRLTFGLISTFAYVLLYRYKSVRERNSFRYLMIDEFQDTNANQMMIAMMVLTEPNLCVVGDWKQGIYGFRNVSIENITDFENRLIRFRRFLNEDGSKRVRFGIDGVVSLPLDENYRSSQKIIDRGYRTLYLKGNSEEVVDEAALDRMINPITAETGILEDVSDIRYVKAIDKDDEIRQVVRAIRDYVCPGRYVIRGRDGTERPVEYGDIAVICRLTNSCRQVMKRCSAENIPSFLHADMEIMSTREGKLALAWLRWVNNDFDTKGIIPILADMNYSMAEIESIMRRNRENQNTDAYPRELMEFRNDLRRKRRRITELLTSVFRFYGLDNDITQSIVTTISSIHRNSLLTISDVIGIISEDIEENTAYRYDNLLDSSAVSIMTMHKSKGLEFPIVIVPFIDQGTTPNTRGDSDVFAYSPLMGIRCTKEVGCTSVNGVSYSKIYPSWKTKVAKFGSPKEYDEERRLLFVTMTRAKQYETLICSKPSGFMTGISEGYTEIPEAPVQAADSEKYAVERPDLSGYTRPVPRLGVHDIMTFTESGQRNMSESEEDVSPKGKEYGKDVHRIAYKILRGFDLDRKEVPENYPEIPLIRKIIGDLKDADLKGEIECGLPIDEPKSVLRGQIDLLAVYPDRIEIHDYKTDVTDENESEYRLQLSVYAHAASSFYGKPASCVIDYVSQGRSVIFDPVSKEQIAERVRSALQSKK